MCYVDSAICQGPTGWQKKNVKRKLQTFVINMLPNNLDEEALLKHCGKTRKC